LNDNCVLCADHLCFQHTHTHTHAHTCMHTHIHTRTHTHTQTQTLAKIHAITHTNICTQMHVAAHFLVPLLLVCPVSPPLALIQKHYTSTCQVSYGRMSQALNATGRPILFSLCSWGNGHPWNWGHKVGYCTLDIAKPG